MKCQHHLCQNEAPPGRKYCCKEHAPFGHLGEENSHKDKTVKSGFKEHGGIQMRQSNGIKGLSQEEQNKQKTPSGESAKQNNDGNPIGITSSNPVHESELRGMDDHLSGMPLRTFEDTSANSEENNALSVIEIAPFAGLCRAIRDFRKGRITLAELDRLYSESLTRIDEANIKGKST